MPGDGQIFDGDLGVASDKKEFQIKRVAQFLPGAVVSPPGCRHAFESALTVDGAKVELSAGPPGKPPPRALTDEASFYYAISIPMIASGRDQDVLIRGLEGES